MVLCRLDVLEIDEVWMATAIFTPQRIQQMWLYLRAHGPSRGHGLYLYVLHAAKGLWPDSKWAAVIPRGKQSAQRLDRTAANLQKAYSLFQMQEAGPRPRWDSTFALAPKAFRVRDEVIECVARAPGRRYTQGSSRKREDGT